VTKNEQVSIRRSLYY